MPAAFQRKKSFPCNDNDLVIHEKFPCYHWKKNKGYPTQEHRAAIAKFGVTEYHRKSFKLLPTQLRLDLG